MLLNLSKIVKKFPDFLPESILCYLTLVSQGKLEKTDTIINAEYFYNDLVQDNKTCADCPYNKFCLACKFSE